MKIRQGFVSNSSSSSFLIYGCELTTDLRAALEERDDFNGVYEFAEANDLEYYCETEEGNVIGISFTSIGEDETPRQFKSRINEQLAGVFGKPVDCELMSGTYPC